MRKLYEWANNNGTEIYEGKYSIIIGDSQFGYVVFANKLPAIKIKVSGDIVYKNSNGRLGKYNNKQEALRLFNKADSAFKEGKVIEVPVEPLVKSELDTGQVVLTRRKRQGGVVIYDPNRLEDKFHEVGHYKLGHLSPKCQKTTLQKESEATHYSIEQMKKRKKYTPTVRKRIAKRFSSYLNKNKKKDALVIIKGLEKG